MKEKQEVIMSSRLPVAAGTLVLLAQLGGSKQRSRFRSLPGSGDSGASPAQVGDVNIKPLGSFVISSIVTNFSRTVNPAARLTSGSSRLWDVGIPAAEAR